MQEIIQTIPAGYQGTSQLLSPQQQDTIKVGLILKSWLKSFIMK